MTTHFLKGKDEAVQVVKDYLAHLAANGKPPKATRTDRGTEFINELLMQWCREHGIDNQITAPYSPAQNGIAERANRTLVELARAMIGGQKLPEYLWEHALAHATYIRNCSYTRTLKGKTPYEIWFQRKPHVAHLREFGAPVWVLLQGQAVQRKMLPKSKRRAYVGYEEGPKAIKYYNAEMNKVLSSRNFRFLSLPNGSTLPEDIVVAPDGQRKGERMGDDCRPQDTQLTGNIPKDVHPTSFSGDPRVVQPRHSPQEDSDSLKRKRTLDEEEETLDPDAEPRKTRGMCVDYRYLNNPFSYKESEVNAAQVETMLGYGDPKSLKEAKNSHEWPKWDRAVKAELGQLLETGTWALVDKPKDAIPIGNKWVFTKKYSKSGELLKYKGRLVAKGYAQRPGYDYLETFSPVVRLETIRAILAIAVVKDLKIQQMDVKGAYLNGILKEKVYMDQPEGFKDGSNRVCLLNKTLYGLKQSGREWNKELDDKLQKHGFTHLVSDPCTYTRVHEDDLEIITVWVDDLLLFATSDERMKKIKDDIRSEWEVTDLGEPAKIVGIEIDQGEKHITISQERYIEAILERQGMQHANPVATPLDQNIKLEPNPDGAEGSRSNSYAQLLGELQFLANATRPDIAHAINRLASYTANPSLPHTGALKRVLRYLAGTKSYGITYSALPIKNRNANLFQGYADSAYANADDYKSTSGYVFLAAGGAITWMSKKQSVITLSSTESEYIALSEAGREACWLRSLHAELGFPQEKPCVLRGDNNGSIAMARNPQFHKKAKHIATKWHWIRNMVDEGVVDIQSCRDPEQTADILTKALARPKHKRHIEEMGLAPT
jgi:hypothetical protein